MRKKDDKPAALDHVLYEIEMLTYSLLALCRPNLPPDDARGWMEVFAIHARNLNEFFGGINNGHGYIKPADFISWVSCYIFSKDIARRASSQIAHLTYDRERPEEKIQWPFVLILKDLREPSLMFLNAVLAVQPLMSYQQNKLRTEVLLKRLPQILPV